MADETNRQEALLANPQEQCPQAGNGENRCPSCGNEIQDGAKFCPSCGTPLIRGEAEKTLSTAIPATVEESLATTESASPSLPDDSHRVWIFNTEKRFIQRHTEIHANGYILDVEQSKRFLFFNFDKQQCTIDIQRISSVIKEVKYSFYGIILIVLGVLSLAVGHFLEAIIGAGIGWSLLKNKYLKIMHKNSFIKIPDIVEKSMRIEYVF